MGRGSVLRHKLWTVDAPVGSDVLVITYKTRLNYQGEYSGTSSQCCTWRLVSQFFHRVVLGAVFRQVGLPSVISRKEICDVGLRT